MPIVHFRGFVIPKIIERLEVGWLEWQEPTLGPLRLKFTIEGNRVVSDCHMPEIDDNRLTLAHFWVFHLIRGYVDAFSFSNGVALTLILNEFVIDSEQVPKQWISRFADLASLCTITADDLFKLTEGERGALKQIHDLTDSLLYPLESFSLCGRAVEGLRRLLLPTGNIKQQWDYMQSNLNLSEAYLKFITDKSILPRHGGTEPVIASELHDIRKRAWTVANRFLEFRKRGNKKLPEADFPLL
jgi:hypothetical protein